MRLPDRGRSRIVLIGASRYSDPALPGLPAVARTVTDLRELLTDPGHGIVPESHCTVLLDDGDLRTVGDRLRSAVADAEDLLLVHYAGHGLVAGRRHSLYLALPDSRWAAPEFNSLEYDKLRDAVLDSPAAAKVVVLDCCFSGRALGDSLGGGTAERLGQLEVAGSYVLTSAQRDQVALALPGEEHTAFSGRLIRLLRDGIPGGPELLTVEDLYRRLRAVMAAEGLPTPLNRSAGTAHSVALGTNRAFAATAPPELRGRHEHAVAQGKAGDWAGAAEQLRETVEAQTRLLGAEHPDTLRGRQSHAHSLGGAGGPAEAAELLRPLLGDQLRLLGPDHEDTLRTRQFLAVNLGEAGHREEAAGMLRVLLTDRGRVLGPDHPHTLRTRHLLARNLALSGAEEEARTLLREVVTVRERVLGAEHPHTRRARTDLADLTEAGDGVREVR
ncbi:caspase, EACC1-associated type [Streptomyces humi]|uniref:caspase, EACC1-associated type n=1 Tax=Streptomyces humi TaxID=1428620 RepID=UPI00069C9D83|nr:tetratricopeptide repeat protein [Streptomyces humi]